ncbi:MAG: sigma-54-dependent Fis family transcriptional regulator [Myxococcales bacterium]|nr:sigma-54-dependent Fis family transcriptional regulator [Myxococcales bacterium]MCB9642773.1 sigma-54-dependent Fis family transcriptional regulator [Myxococcales bacterium]
MSKEKDARLLHPLVYVVDDDEDMRGILRLWLEEAGYQVEEFENARSMLESMREVRPQTVIMDLMMPVMGGLEALQEMRAMEFWAPVIILTASDTARDALQAIKLGAYDYLVKPVERDRLVASMRNAVERYLLQAKVEELEAVVQERYEFQNIVGASETMEQVFQDVRKVAPSSISVYIFGESGTGKELIANAIHHAGQRRVHPFVALNCAAIPESLLESELFGHEKGAFTGAHNTRKGCFERAHGGTLFLDEIGEMSFLSQAKLLRVLQEQSLVRVGGTRLIQVDVRVICASNRNLEEMVQEGAFREDLYYRLAGYTVYLPSLRERKDDIPLLIQYFLKKFQHESERQIQGFSEQAMEALLGYHWPGNVRELANVVNSAVVSTDHEMIPLEALPKRIFRTQQARQAARGDVTDAIIPLEDLEKQAILNALRLTKGNVESAARKLQIGRATLYRKLAKYKDVEVKNFKAIHD